MFIVTTKLSRKKALAVVLIIAILIATIIILAGHRDQNPAGVQAETASDIVAYLETLGWQVTPDPLEVREVLIPREFTQAYETYNALQLEAGFDLTTYKGRPATQHTYQVLNYPNQPDGVVADVLVSNGRIIGGSIQSVHLDGFIHGLFPNLGT